MSDSRVTFARPRRKTLGQRKLIFAELVALQDSGSMTVSASRLAVRFHHGLSDEQLRAIEDEGIDHNWPPLDEERGSE